VKIYRQGEIGFKNYLSKIERRLFKGNAHLESKVRSIIQDVKERGDKALLHYCRIFDNISLSPKELKIPEEEIKRAFDHIPKDFLRTLKKAAQRIRRFHQRVFIRSTRTVVERGIILNQILKPIERVGIYVPGGKASYPSTVLMAAIPAKIAGVREIIMTTPPQKELNPSLLVAADLAGVDHIFRIGGVQAISAMAYGTYTIPKVDKIVGPGNQYVAMAKRLLYGVVDLDMVAGPSEIVVISDGSGSPSFVATDLLSQAEHDEMAIAILITNSESFANLVRKELKKRLSSIEKGFIARKSLNQWGAILIVRNIEEAIELSNRIAPEHLELHIAKPRSYLKKIRNAGAVFLGYYTPEAIGDYMAGPNHILPTGGTARFFSPLGVEDFIKRMNVIQFNEDALRRFEKDVRLFTEWEGLEGHYRALKIRI
jgi:histidinol dehydrogenase